MCYCGSQCGYHTLVLVAEGVDAHGVLFKNKPLRRVSDSVSASRTTNAKRNPSLLLLLYLLLVWLVSIIRLQKACSEIMPATSVNSDNAVQKSRNAQAA